MRDRTRTRTLLALLPLTLGIACAAATAAYAAPNTARARNPPATHQTMTPAKPLANPCRHEQARSTRPPEPGQPSPRTRAAYANDTHPAARARRQRRRVTRRNDLPANHATSRRTLAAARESRT